MGLTSSKLRWNAIAEAQRQRLWVKWAQRNAFGPSPFEWAAHDLRLRGYLEEEISDAIGLGHFRDKRLAQRSDAPRLRAVWSTFNEAVARYPGVDPDR